MNAVPISDRLVVLAGLLVSALMTAGNYFQKLNGTRGGGVALSVWVVLATACFLPTFFLGNLVYLRGGRVSVFVPVTALTYVATFAVGRFAFREPVGTAQIAGCLLVVAGVALIARGAG